MAKITSKNNNLLRDLIRILILNELLRRRHNRPQFPGNPPRPPMPRPRPPYPRGNTQAFWTLGTFLKVQRKLNYL